MDQSASVFAQRDAALLVSFVPSLFATPVHLPATGPPLVFVVAQSLVAADKHVTAPVCYNLRVVEVTLAALALGKLLGLPELERDASPLGVSLRGLHEAYFSSSSSSSKSSSSPSATNDKKNKSATDDTFSTQLSTLLRLSQEHLTQEQGYTRADLSRLTGLDEAALEDKYMRRFPVRAERFLLRQRAAHVFAEAGRVQRAAALFNDAHADRRKKEQAGSKQDDVLLASLGALLNETQKSCREQYDCSCPELDELCSIALAAGAYGSRLTGAGWGGCSVHLVPEDKVRDVTRAWEKEYYKKRWPEMSQEDLDEAVVVSRPGGGSCVFVVNGEVQGEV